MCEKNCNYVQIGDCNCDCSGTITTSDLDYGYVVPNIQGEPVTVSTQRDVFSKTLAYGYNTKVLLNGKVLPFVLNFCCSKEGKSGDFTCILGENILPEEIEDGSELKIFVTIGEKEVVLFEEKIHVFDKVYTCDADVNLIKVTIMFEKFE